MRQDRRTILKMSAGAVAGGLAVGFGGLGKAFADSCGLTPPQTSGPFYPGEQNFTADTDLTRVAGHAERAKGQVIYVRGRVVDAKCRPVAGAAVEIWQACESGRYNNPKDTNPAALDPDFKYWGEAGTDSQGRYLFKTIIPGAYPADTDWIRPPHIHFKVAKIGFHDLVTQLYFMGNQYNAADLILKAVPAAERERVIVEFKAAGPEFEPGTLLGDFEITVRSVR